jgi:hypothetical protein
MTRTRASNSVGLGFKSLPGGEVFSLSIVIRDSKSLKTKLIYVIFKNSVRTSNKTQHVTITKIDCLILFQEIIDVLFLESSETVKYIIQC